MARQENATSRIVARKERVFIPNLRCEVALH
jgi:hypothetical protein